MGWRRVTSDSQGGKMLSTMTMDPASSVECNMSNESSELFVRQVGSLPLYPNSLIKRLSNIDIFWFKALKRQCSITLELFGFLIRFNTK